MATEASINDRRRAMGLPPHKHFYRVAVADCNDDWIEFICEYCGHMACTMRAMWKLMSMQTGPRTLLSLLAKDMSTIYYLDSRPAPRK